MSSRRCRTAPPPPSPGAGTARRDGGSSASARGRSQPQAASAAAATAAGHARDAARERRGVARAPGRRRVAAGVPPASAAANSAALANRSAGSFSSAVRTAAATCGGTVLRSVVTGCGCLGDDLRDDLPAPSRPVNGGSPVEHLVQHAAERVDVGARRRSPARPSPARGSCSAACRGSAPSRSSAPPAAALTASAMPKSATSALPVVQQDVLGLDVAVDHAVAVRVVERVGHLAWRCAPPRRRRAASRGRAGRAASRPRRTASRRRGSRRPSPRVEQRQDVRMLQARRGLDLDQEPLGAEHGGELGLAAP